MKVAVYSIALNEAKFAERWADSAAEADYRVVADTGSTRSPSTHASSVPSAAA